MTAPASPRNSPAAIDPEAPIPGVPTEIDVKRVRERRPPGKVRELKDRETMAARVTNFYRNAKMNRREDEDNRLQQYAKYRQWTEGARLPWDDASDVAIPDAAKHSQSTQDALFNAFLSTRPAITSQALNAADEGKGRTLDQLLDTQFFEENDGESLMTDIIDLYVNEGVATLYIPWVRETQNVKDMRIFAPLPPSEEMLPAEVFGGLIEQEWPKEQWNTFKQDDEGWEWTVEPGEGNTEGTKKKVSFYTRPKTGQIEMFYEHEITTFDGPKIKVIPYADVITPIHCANLQKPTPSNPGGAPFVIIRERITVDEIKKLRKTGFFDLITNEQMERIEQSRESSDETREQDQKRKMQGQEEHENVRENQHTRLTLLRCFDMFDLDGDGENEDVVWWVILETKTLCKVKYMTEMYPFNPPKRPFAETAFIKVPGFREGISILELIEGMHDLRKFVLDLGVDAQTLLTMPFGFYKPSSSLNPEPLKLWPGELHPLQNPQQDVNFPNLGANNSQAAMFNMLTWAQTQEEGLTLVGDIQQGRVPAGRSSALRTSGGIAQLMAAGSARPERILRQLFKMMRDAYSFMHSLNRAFLPDEKEFLVSGILKPDERPYQTIKRQDLQGEFRFRFEANVGNSSRGAKQESLERMLGLYVNELAITLGVVTPQNYYTLLRDIGISLGPDPDPYITSPDPKFTKLQIMAEQAITAIMYGHMPAGVPREPAEEHLQILIGFTDDPQRISLLDGPRRVILNDYMEQVKQIVQQEQEQKQLAAAAQEAGQAGQAEGTPGPQAGPVPLPQQTVQANEPVDEDVQP